MSSLSIVWLLIVSAGTLLVLPPTLYALGVVPGRTARILFLCELGIAIILIGIGIATGRISFYFHRIRTK
jgi:hypothetical protein